MGFETINVLADPKQVKIIREIINSLIEKNPGLFVSPFQYGKLGDSTMVTFKIDKSQYESLIGKLISNSIRVVTFDDRSKRVVDSIKSQASGGLSGGAQSKSNVQNKPEVKKSLDEMVDEGDYIGVINMSRDVTIPIPESDRAKSLIDTAILKAINTPYSEGVRTNRDLFRNIETLVKIGSDNILKTIHRIQHLKQAGMYAIELCSLNKDYVGDLVNICNNSSLHSMVNIKAAVRFSEIVFKDKEVYKNEIAIAQRSLNTRFLNTAFMGVEQDLSVEERKAFNYLIDYLKNK